MDVVILAGGLGTRLRSVVSEVPKCMAPVNNKPFLFYLLKYLSSYPNINKVVLSVGYLKEIIYKWIDENHSNFPFEICYAVEEKPLGTGGGIKNALTKCISDNVLILNGDTFFDINIQELENKHNEINPDISLVLKPMKNFDRYGTVVLDKNGFVESFNEKSFCKDGLINGGVYLINRNKSNLDSLPEKFSFEKDVLEPGAYKKSLYGIIQDGYFIDIGIPADYHKADVEFKTLFK